MKNLLHAATTRYASESLYKQEKVKTLLISSFFLSGITAIGLCFHVAEEKNWPVLSGDLLLVFTGLCIWPLVYAKQFKFTVNLVIVMLIAVALLHNVLTDFLSSSPLTHYRMLESVLFFVIVILSVTAFGYASWQHLFTSVAGFLVISLHYIVITEKFYSGLYTVSSLALYTGYLLLFLSICFICFYLLGTFQLLFERLETESQKVKTANLRLEARVRKRTKALDRQNKALKKVNAELDRFVYSISHDLRAPLSSVLGLINIARQETDLQRIEHYLDLKEKSVKRLDNFILDMISISKNARLKNKYETVILEPLLNRTIEQYSYLHHFNQLTKHIQIYQSHPLVTDAYRLSIILSNLIANAIRYAAPHRRAPYLKIKVDVTAAEASIVVEDNGQGIAPEHIDRIFQMFFRASHDTAGSGLGLYMVKEVVEKLHGQVYVTSTLGKGTSFTVVLPNKAVRYDYQQFSEAHHQFSDTDGSTAL